MTWRNGGSKKMSRLNKNQVPKLNGTYGLWNTKLNRKGTGRDILWEIRSWLKANFACYDVCVIVTTAAAPSSLRDHCYQHQHHFPKALSTLPPLLPLLPRASTTTVWTWVKLTNPRSTWTSARLARTLPLYAGAHFQAMSRWTIITKQNLIATKYTDASLSRLLFKIHSLFCHTKMAPLLPARK